MAAEWIVFRVDTAIVVGSQPSHGTVPTFPFFSTNFRDGPPIMKLDAPLTSNPSPRNGRMCRPATFIRRLSVACTLVRSPDA